MEQDVGRSIVRGMVFLLLGAFTGAAQNPEKLVVPVGTKFRASLQTPISSKLSEVGDPVALQLMEPLRIDDRHVLPRGSELTGRVTQVKSSGRIKGRAEVYALVNELTTNYGSEPIIVSIVAADDMLQDEKIKTDEEGKLIANRSIGNDLGQAAKGAGLGSLATTPVAIATDSVAPAIAGPAAGALAGLLLGRGKEIRLPVGTVFRMRLDKELVLPASAAVTLAGPPPPGR